MNVIEAQEWALTHNKQLVKDNLTPCLIVSGQSDDIFPFLNIGNGIEAYNINFDMTYNDIKEKVKELLTPRYTKVNTNCADILGETLYIGKGKTEFKVKSANIQSTGTIVTSEDGLEARLGTLWRKL